MTDLLTDAIKVEYLLLFLSEVNKDRLSNIRKLYEAAHITNDMLVQQLHRHTDVMADLDHCVFSDISTILAEELAEKETLASYFDTLYEKQYGKIYAEHESVRTALVGDPEEGQKTAHKTLQWIFQEDGQDIGEQCLGTLLILRDPVFLDNGVIHEETIKNCADEWNLWVSGANERRLQDEELVFTDGQEPVYASRMYAKFVRKTREGIDDDPDGSRSYESAVASDAALRVIQNHHGSAKWFQMFSAPRGRGKGNAGYRPDADQILDAYCRARVEAGYDRCKASMQPFTKADLMRECRAENPKEDALAMHYLSDMDIVYAMFEHLLELYYRNFSWDAISGISPEDRTSQMLRDLESSVAEKDRTIADLHRRIDVLRAAENKNVNAGRVAVQKENERLLDTIEQKDREIAELQERVQEQKELEDASEKPEGALNGIEVDLPALQKKRYLFVAHTKEDYPVLDHTLKQYFPDSIFMEEKTDNIDQVQVDAVVFIIKWLSHAMYYKARSTPALKDVPVIFCNTGSIDRILQEMQEGWQEREKK